MFFSMRLPFRCEYGLCQWETLVKNTYDLCTVYKRIMPSSRLNNLFHPWFTITFVRKQFLLLCFSKTSASFKQDVYRFADFRIRVCFFFFKNSLGLQNFTNNIIKMFLQSIWLVLELLMNLACCCRSTIMGKLLSLLARDENSCCSAQQKYDIFLDFESKYITYLFIIFFWKYLLLFKCFL